MEADSKPETIEGEPKRGAGSRPESAEGIRDLDSMDGITDEDKEKSSKEQKVSICFDPGLYGLVTGATGILEGFGLLNFKAENMEMPKELEQAVTNVLEGHTSLEESIAGMQDNLPGQGEPQIEQIAAEYTGSLTAADGQGAENHVITAEEKASKSAPGQNMNSTGGQYDKADKIWQMTNAAITGKNSTPDKNVQANKKDAEPKEAVSFMAGSGLAERQTVKPAITDTAPVEETSTVKQQITDNVSNIVEKLSARSMEGMHEFDVTLKPEFLGKLSIKVIMDSEGMKAKLKTGDATVKALLSEQLPALQEMLEEKGIHVVQMEVAYENTNFESGGQYAKQNSGSGNSHNKQKKTGSEIQEVSIGYDILSETNLSARNCSVEFQA